MKRKFLAGGAVALLAIGAAFAYSRFSGGIEVDVFEARKGTIEEYVTSVSAGTVKSRQESTLSAEVGGRTVKVFTAEGTSVGKGDPLALLSDPELERQTEAARSDVLSAREGLREAEARRDEAERRYRAETARAANNLRKAKEDHQRASQLFRGGFLSKSEMETADIRLANAEEDVRLAAAGEDMLRAIGREIESLKARVDSAKAKAASLADRLEKLRIAAPYAGIVIRKTVEVGETKTPGAPLFVLADPDDIYIETPIDESETAKIKVGQKAKLFPDAYLGETFAGTVSEIKPVVEVSKEVSRANTIRVLPESPPKPLRLGMSVDVEVRTGGKDNVVLAPSAAVMEREGQKFVFVVVKGKAVRKDVTTGISNWERTEILGGISPGDAIITSLEIKNLGPGSRVGIRSRK
ncbi:MAG TPA: efflux RND transporter periplasmic adaptor subunit [Candidatus Limnocylindrales bacterium]|nr:efflux RND transporter periplasmic adaptor subunit [Candidatus Limnocylindrales bacterium]